MDWDSVDWPALARLRDRFIARHGDSAATGPYWIGPDDLASYDFTFGRRIAWKWAAVLEPLLARGWTPSVRAIVDWGCGTAIAARSLLAHAPADSFDEVILWDHAPTATTFAANAIQARRPQLKVHVADPGNIVRDGAFVLVVSHVLNELDSPGRAALLTLAHRAAAVLWVEPGTSDDSRSLIAVREEMRATFHCWAPCPHDGACGLLDPENARHWCHHFARPPTEAFTEKGWAGFGRRLGIDLRSLPYSYLVLDRRAPARRPDLVRLIGAPRASNALMRLLRCQADGVREAGLAKRAVPALWRSLDKERHDGLFTWSEANGRITDGSPLP